VNTSTGGMASISVSSCAGVSIDQTRSTLDGSRVMATFGVQTVVTSVSWSMGPMSSGSLPVRYGPVGPLGLGQQLLQEGLVQRAGRDALGGLDGPMRSTSTHRLQTSNADRDWSFFPSSALGCYFRNKAHDHRGDRILDVRGA